jgi:Nuclease-related domain
VSLGVSNASQRLIYPPLEALAGRGLTAGETRVLDYLARTLPWSWEIYVQPHLNNLRPDFVLLEPAGKVLVVEVKDWTHDSWQIRWTARPGCAPLPVATRGADKLHQRNPIEQVLNYRSEISDLYSIRADGRSGPTDVALVFPFAPREVALAALAPALEHRSRTSIPIVGSDDLENPDFNFSLRASDSCSPEAVARLREWLVGPAEIISTQPVPLTPRQRELMTTRTHSGFRRIRGAAGSGKSLVLAGRAAQLSLEGKAVLVVSYNHTLNSYLRRTANLFPLDADRITWLGYHEWCSRVMVDTGRWPLYKALWGASSTDVVLHHELPRAVAEALNADHAELTPRYDAILVDEGQDLLPEWWDSLRRACRPGGEMVLAADLAQDVFGRASSWTEMHMTGAGFTGRWADLGASHRMPLPLIPLARDFARQFLPQTEVLLPEAPRQLRLDVDRCGLRWVQTSDSRLLDVTVSEVERVLETADVGNRFDRHTAGDFVLLTDANARGRELVDLLEARGHEVTHTFATSSREARGAKKAFFLGGNRIRATTAHSFKGWEAPLIVVCIANGKTQQALALLYSAMTRLKANTRGSQLAVVSAESRLERYGATWPESIQIL